MDNQEVIIIPPAPLKKRDVILDIPGEKGIR
jgi:hypothetical protein